MARLKTRHHFFGAQKKRLAPPLIIFAEGRQRLLDTSVQAVAEIPKPSQTVFQLLDVMVQPFPQMPAVIGMVLAQLVETGQFGFCRIDSGILKCSQSDTLKR